jgi:small subunit ribosomal protein S3Ae
MAVKKTKDWFTIVAPKYFGEKELGKSFSAEPTDLIGRRFTVNAADLTNNFSKFYVKFFFKVVKVDGKKAFTEFDGLECMRDYISRMVLYYVKRMDAVQDLTTKDGVKLRVKSLVIAPKGIGEKSRRELKKKTVEMMADFVQNSTVEEFIKKVLSDETKNRIFQELRKIHPMRYFEVRKVEVLK